MYAPLSRYAAEISPSKIREGKDRVRDRIYKGREKKGREGQVSKRYLNISPPIISNKEREILRVK
jgi:hypothetical protein